LASAADTALSIAPLHHYSDPKSYGQRSQA
jgi:hypothetical protein